MYDLVFKKSPKGNMIVTKKPDMSKVKWSKAGWLQLKLICNRKPESDYLPEFVALLCLSEGSLRQ